MRKTPVSTTPSLTTYNTEKKVFDRFLTKIVADPITGCWNYVAGSSVKTRYGQFWDGRQNVNAHKYAYDSMVDTVPSDRVICHSCDNKACCNFLHLSVQTQQQNMQEASARGLLKTPRRKYRKITDDIRTDIRTRVSNGQTAYAIGKALDISAIHVTRIIASDKRKPQPQPVASAFVQEAA